MLKVSNVSKTYKMSTHTVEALKNVDFEIEGKQLVCIVGESGSGKTTLMNIMGALDSDFEGDIIINGKSLKEAKNKDLDSYRKNTIGFIFQHFSLIHSLNSKQNVELAYDLSNMKAKPKSEKSAKLLSLFGLGKHLKHRVNRLSGGQKQRVAISRALANDPDIILADEPTGALDSKTGYQVMEMLRELTKTKLVIVITHSPELADEFADTIITIEDGKIREIIKNRLNKENQTKESHEVEAIISNDSKERSKMSFLRAWKHSFRSMMLRKGRTIATSIGLSIGIIGIGLALSLSNGASKTAESQIRQIIPYNTLTVSRVGENEENVKPYTMAEIEKIMKIDDRIKGYTLETEVYPFPIQSSLNREDLDATTNRHVFIISTNNTSATIGDEISIGENAVQRDEIVLSMSTAKTLNPDDVSSLIGKPYYTKYVYYQGMGPNAEVIEFIHEFKIVGITANNTMMDTIYNPNGALEEIFSEKLNMSIDEMQIRGVSFVVDAPAKDMSKLIESLNSSQDQYEFYNLAELILDGINVVLDQITYVLIGFSSISVFVAVLMIAVVIMISVIERTQEIGVLRAIGARTKDIRNIFVSEATIIGLLSGVIGVSVTYGLCQLINTIVGTLISEANVEMAATANVKIAQLSLSAAVGLVVVCVLLSVLSGLIPSIRAAKLDPVKSLKAK